MSEKLFTPPFRVSFPQLFEAKGYKGGRETYSVVMLFDVAEIKKNPKHLKLFKAMQVAMKEAFVERWPKKMPEGVQSPVPGGFKNPFRKGTEKDDVDGYGEGIIFVRASTEHQPGVVDKTGHDIMKASEVYAGCYAHATVNTFNFDTAGNKGIAFGLQNLQKLEEGDPFGNRSTPEQDFGLAETSADEEVEETEDDLDKMFT